MLAFGTSKKLYLLNEYNLFIVKLHMDLIYFYLSTSSSKINSNSYMIKNSKRS